MSGRNIFRATHEQMVHRSASQYVAQLASEPGWDVDRSPTTGDSSTAEWHDDLARRAWRIGLTPVRADVVAAMLWTGDRLVHHARGTEAAMCAIARHWISIVAENGNLASK